MNIPDYVMQFMQTFRVAGYEIFLVGGAVRDLLLEKTTDNWDFTSNAKPEDIQKLFPDAYYNNTYGTVTVPIDIPSIVRDADLRPLQSKILMEITPYRKEEDYTDGRHPDKISWADTIEEDLARRDFTINAMASDGEKIIDLFGGQKDLRAGMIKSVGDPDRRFNEDALRLLRAIRFASQLGFLIEEKTRESITSNAYLIAKISWERIRDEFLKILASNHPAEGVLFLRSTGLLKRILPEVDICFNVQQKSPKRHHIYDVGTHLVMSLKHCPSKDPIVRFAALIHDIGKERTYRKDPETQLITFHNHEVVGRVQAKQIADRFKLSNKQKEKLVRLVEHHQFTVSEDVSDKGVRRFIRDVGLEYVNDMLDLRTADRIGSGATPTSWRLDLFKKRIIEVQKEPFQVKDLKINGYDVMKTLGIDPGPQIGDTLDTIFAEVEEGKLKNEREELMKRLEEFKK